MIHLVIGSVYSVSVLYSKINKITNWDNSVMITGFALAILALGITAALHQRFFAYSPRRFILFNTAGVWIFSQGCIWLSILYAPHNTLHYYFWSIVLGVSIGLLYVIPINLITAKGYKRMGLASGLVVCCFGLGSIIAAKIFSIIPYLDVFNLYIGYYFVMIAGCWLIQDTSDIQPSEGFSRDKRWYILAGIFFMNIGVGISLLSNLASQTIERGFSIENAVLLVALAGVTNTLGRLIYSAFSDYVGKIPILKILLIFQFLAVIALHFFDTWYWSVVAIISVYGGVFAIMPSLMKQLYNTSAAYSQVLIMWGLAGLIYPILFNHFGFPLLIISSSLLVISCLVLPKHN